LPHLLIAYNVRVGKLGEYREFLNSSEFGNIRRKIEEESGFKFVETYFQIIPSAHGEGDFDAYDMWEFPNMAAFDKAREVNAFREMVERTYNMVEPRPSKMTLLRTARDVKVIFEPKTDK
jgi:hypothetical protein